jgi:ankyrin repeat protein
MDANLSLLEASMHGDYDVASEALRHGADPNAVLDGHTPLCWASQEGHTDVVRLLLDAGAEVNFSDPLGFTPLFKSIGDPHLDTAELLLLRGADVDHRCRSSEGCTVLHIAAAFGRLECISLLLLYGAKRSALNDRDQTPYHTAIECHEFEAAALLELDCPPS